MAVTATVGPDLSAHTQGAEVGHQVDAAAELIAVVERRALLDIQPQQVAFAVDLLIAERTFIAHANARDQLPRTHGLRGK